MRAVRCRPTLAVTEAMTVTSTTTTHLTELGREECVRHLCEGGLGRVAVSAPGWPPLIRPVLYAFDAPTQSVVFRSAAGSKLTSLLRSQRAAFEIDGLEPGGGWSVIVLGPVEEVTGAAELARLALLAAGAGLPHCMRIRAAVISGRRLDG